MNERTILRAVNEPFSVLMAVYGREQPVFLKEALESIKAQTLRPAEMVIVEDGPLSGELNDVIDDYSAVLPIKRVKLLKNEGLGRALAVGIIHCSYELVARCDSDDINLVSRFELELNYLRSNPDIAVVGSWIEEFEYDPNTPESTRVTPEHHSEILRALRWRNPFNHMTVMFRRSWLLAAGNYEPLPFFEDYWLWIRLAQVGALFGNLPIPLVRARLGNGMLNRRRGASYLAAEVAFQNACRRLKYIGVIEFLLKIAVRNGLRLLPFTWFRLTYKRMLRRQVLRIG